MAMNIFGSQKIKILRELVIDYRANEKEYVLKFLLPCSVVVPTIIVTSISTRSDKTLLQTEPWYSVFTSLRIICCIYRSHTHKTCNIYIDHLTSL